MSALRILNVLPVFVAIAVSLLLSAPLQLHAQSPAIDFTQLGTGYDYHQGSYSLGWRFNVLQNVTVSALGFYDDKKDGLTESHAVGIFDADNCQLITSTTVVPADPLTGFFRYRSVPQVVLTGGKSYYIAAVTGSEKYAISLPTLDVHPSISFVGFSIYGQTQSTSSLLCPNGAQAPGFNGDFGPNFLISSGDGGENPGNGNKRATAISLFCNRTGVGLNTAICSATVADSGPPQRTSPTGTVRFTATDGFFPDAAECLLSATQYSPGISSCQAQFAVPDGFPIGVKFPIEAVYDGNDTFEAAATSHELIKAGCVETPGSPCPNSIGLSFDGYPAIVKDKLSLYINCGQKSSALLAAIPATAPEVLADAPGSGSCTVGGSFGLDLKKLFGETSQEDFIKMAEAIDPKDAKRDIMLQVIQEAAELQQERFRLMQQTQEAIFKLQQDILNDRVKVNEKAKIKWDAYIRDLAVPPQVLRAKASAKARKKPAKDRLDSNPISVTVKQSSQELVKLKSRKRLNRLFAVAREAQIPSLPLQLRLKLKQKGVKGTGTVTETFDVAIQ